METADSLFDGDCLIYIPFSRRASAGDSDNAVLSFIVADAGTANYVMVLIQPSSKPNDNGGRKRGRHAEVLRAPRILIVDDNEADAGRIATALRNPASKIGQLDCEISWVKDVSSAREHVERDEIDLYFLDLDISERWWEPIGKEIGKAFVRDVIDLTSGGIIVCSNLPIDEEAPPLIDYGADDYVEKSYGFMTIAPRALSVWRRAHTERRSKQSHSGRKFLIGDWMFTVGNRQIIDAAGNSKRLSITEHIFLRHLCVVDDHAINGEVFNIEVLRREIDDKHVHLDVFVPRLRAKLNDSIDLDPTRANGDL